jgi:hypothetical protein
MPPRTVRSVARCVPCAVPTAAAACLALAGAVSALAGCANAPLPNLSTGSLFGGGDAKAAAPQPPQIRNDPVARTLQVARVSARAERCGFHFDAARLKANFIAAEGAQPGADVAALGKLDQTYTVTTTATAKVIAGDEGYCSEARTAHIKGDLTRHLAGDYTPGKAFVKEDDSLFSFGGGGILGGEKAEE